MIFSIGPKRALLRHGLLGPKLGPVWGLLGLHFWTVFLKPNIGPVWALWDHGLLGTKLGPVEDLLGPSLGLI